MTWHALAAGGHGDGYALYQLGRWLWHQIGWWSVPVTGAAGGLLAFARALFGRD